MTKSLSLAIAVLLFWTLPGLAQEGLQVNFDVSGSVRTSDGFALPNVRVVFDRSGSKSDVRTDVNGEFKASLFHGDYLVSVEGAGHKASQPTVLQVGKGMVQVPMNLVVEVEDIPEGTINYPKIEKFVLPTYPPAARAVRAEGEVKVEARISTNGELLDTKALDGHPLLRAASVQAVRRWIFEPPASEQSVVVTFVFLVGELKNVTRLRINSYRHYVITPPPTVCP